MAKRITYLTLLLFLLLLNPDKVFSQQTSQVVISDAQMMLESLDPEERVGQLFVVSYYGSDLTASSEIYQLLTDIPLGGIIIRPKNGNFNSVSDLPSSLYNITSTLQRIQAGQRYDDIGELTESNTDAFIPLLIGFDDGMSGWPMAQYPGFSDIPSNMTLGATWNPEYSYEVGRIVGREMQALGFNLYLGPNADVSVEPQPFSAGDQGNQIFGGNPYWASQMSAFYSGGVQAGSDGMVAVFPRTFPGKGSADRSSGGEIPTVRTPQEILIMTDLLPFIALTEDEADMPSQADGLMSAHVRYLGLQSEISLSNIPISLDPLAMESLLSLEPIADWREQGGVILSEPLGVQGIRTLYDPRGVVFLNRRIAQDAFTAGNDLLYFHEFGLNPATDQTNAIKDTYDFFVNAYQNDPTFQQKVDESVLRILQLKLELYEEFSLGEVIPRQNSFDRLPENTDVFSQIARDAISLLSPASAEQIPSIQNGENLVIITDTKETALCPSCQQLPTTAVDSFQSSILRVFGPQASGFISYANIASYSFTQVSTLLDTNIQALNPEAIPQIDPLSISLNEADWIVFLMRGYADGSNSPQVVKKFLQIYQPLLQGKIILISMDAPYYLDSTDVSKLTSYIALYDDDNDFLDLASRSIFQPSSFPGASPVTIEGTGYRIDEMTSPDPYLVIFLDLSVLDSTTPTSGTPRTGDLTPDILADGTTEDFRAELGDTVLVQTHAILDRNGHPIADGTPVTFRLRYITEGLEDSTTVSSESGIARATLLLSRPGNLIISAYTGGAQSSTSIQLSIPNEGAITINLNNPENVPTPGGAPTAIPDLINGSSTIDTDYAERTMVRFGDLFLAVVGLIITSAIVFLILNIKHSINDALVSALAVMIIGLVAYICFALQIPGALFWYELAGRWAAVLATWIGGFAGFLITRVFFAIWRHSTMRNRV